MTITERLINLDPSLVIHNEGEWSKTVSDYSAFNDAGVECEVGEFLYSMVRILKPNRVLETGTHWGIGASYMGLALKDNKKGELDTVEFLPEIYGRALERIHKLNLIDFVNVNLTDAAKFDPPANYGMILLDTEPQTRFAEFVKFYDYLEPGGFLFIHDLHRHMHHLPQLENQPDHPGQPYWPYGKIPGFMTELVRTGAVKPFHFGTPRGFTGFYKSHLGDYRWG